jgi:DNA-binding winged helix-turn-helix (wHTH) protein/tetratricopeptide (TPR) repeat protein
VLRFAGFELDERRAELRGPDGQAVRLRPKPFAMLQVFVANAGRLLGKQELMQAVWPDIHVGEDSLFQCIREIRTALGDQDRALLRVVSGRGYLFEAEVVRVPAEIAAPAESAAADQTDDGKTLGQDLVAATKPEAAKPAWRLRVPRPILAAGVAGLCAIVGLAAAASGFRPGLLAAKQPTVAVTIIDPGNDPQTSLMAGSVAADVGDGLAEISNIRVLSPPERTAFLAAMPVAFTPAAKPDILVEGRLHKDDGVWTLQARATNTRSGEVRWSTSITVGMENTDEMLQRSRLAGGLGHALAVYLNSLYYPGERPDASAAQAHAKIVVEQATAYIDRTSHERFTASQTMLEEALAKDPDNVDLQAALVADLLRGIQTAWYTGADADAAERKAQSLLARGLQNEPQYLPVLEGYCRFLTATNRFVDALVACANALTFDPWDGLMRFNLGLAQDQLGRFSEALATFKDADRFDTPQVSRWTWLLGAGLTYILMDRDEEALPWLQRSLAITPGTGRTQMLLAGAYQRLGRRDDAAATMAKAMQARPGSTLQNFKLPSKNTSPLWLAAAEKIDRAVVAAGLPER